MGILGLLNQHVKKFIYVHHKYLLNPKRYYLNKPNEEFNNVSSLSIDANALIYSIIKIVFFNDEKEGKEEKKDKHHKLDISEDKPLPKKIYNEKINQVFEMYWECILMLLTLIKPKDTLIIAMDGVAPAGKIKQQRQRRFKIKSNIFNTNCISPGTSFMISLDTFLTKKINQYHDTCNVNKIIYSSHMVPGEGEHKIMDYFRNGDVIMPNGMKHVFHSMDADMTQLAILLGIPNIVLFRETGDDDLSIAMKEKYIHANTIEIDYIKRYLTKRLINKNKTKFIFDDYILIIMMIGNDFLSKQLFFKDIGGFIERCFDIYNKYDLFFVYKDEHEKKHIHWGKFSILLYQIASIEFDTIYEKKNEKNTVPEIMMASKKKGFDSDLFYELYYKKIFGYSASQEKYIHSLIHIIDDSNLTNGYFEPTIEKIDQMCIDYFSMLQWNFMYYQYGHNVVDPTFVYAYPFAPLFYDIYRIGSELKDKDLPSPWYKIGNKTNDFTIIDQMISIFPASSKDLIPNELDFLMSNECDIVDLFPTSWPTYLYFSTEEYHTMHNMIVPDRERIIDAVNNIPLSKKTEKLKISGKDLIHTKENELLRYFNYEYDSY